MKKIMFSIVSILLLSFGSCMKIDNYDEPDSWIQGRIIDTYTGDNFLSSQGGYGIRIWERSWEGGNATHQTLAVKQDGSYTNTKLFAGTYDMLCYGGAFWPADTVKNVNISPDGTSLDFEVTPYLQVENFEYRLEPGGSTGYQVTLSCSLHAPVTDGLPNLYSLQSFVNTTPWCGSTAFISINDYTSSAISFMRSWEDEMVAQGLPATSKTSVVYTLPAMPVKSGYTYWVRVGVSVNDAHRNYNYSEIATFEVP